MPIQDFTPLWAMSLCKAAVMQGKDPHEFLEEKAREAEALRAADEMRTEEEK